MQTILQVGERIAHVPGRLRQILGFQLDRAGEETDDAEVIARMKRAHQTLHRQGDFFRRGEAPFPAHRPAHVQKQHGGGAGVELGFVNGKVFGPDPHRHAAAVQQRVLERLHHVDMERIALNVGPAGFEKQLPDCRDCASHAGPCRRGAAADKYRAAPAGRPAARLWE